MLYELLTGEPPFPGEDAVAIIGQHLNTQPVAPSRHRPEVTPALDRLILRLLSKSPDDRPQSAAEARREIEAAATAEPTPEAPENPLERLAGGVFVGRDAELDRMRAELEARPGGEGRLLLISGDPGIGKTRAAEQLATYARVRGARVYWGRCHEAEGQPPYWPWSEALRSYVRDADPVGLRWELGGRAADVAQIVPEVAEVLGDVGEPPDMDTEQARFRLFDSFAGFLAGASGARPLVIVLDDLHWADEPSLQLLRFVARRLAGTNLLLIGTYRDVELGRHHPLADTLGDLAGVDGTRRVALKGLDPAGIADYIELTAGVDRPPRDLAEAIHDQTAGNPFFIGEVVRLMAAEGLLGEDEARNQVAIPQGVREVIGRRLDRLSDDANEALRVAAVCGREFRADVIERVVRARPPAGGRGPGRSRWRPARRRRSRARPVLVLPRPRPRDPAGRGPAARRVTMHLELGEALEEVLRRRARPPPRRSGVPLHRGGAAGRRRPRGRLRDSRGHAGPRPARLRGRRRATGPGARRAPAGARPGPGAPARAAPRPRLGADHGRAPRRRLRDARRPRRTSPASLTAPRSSPGRPWGSPCSRWPGSSTRT